MTNEVIVEKTVSGDFLIGVSVEHDYEHIIVTKDEAEALLIKIGQALLDDDLASNSSDVVYS